MELAAFIISIVALVVAIVAGVSVFQMFFGKPKIKVSFEKTLGYKLTCWIKSVPPSKFLSLIGVDRRILDIDCETTICDMGGKIVESFSYPTASSRNLRIHIVEVKDKDRISIQIFLKDQFNGFARELNIGSYILEMEIWDTKDNVQIQKIQKYFKVNQDNPFVEWREKGQNGKTQNS
jgi:hypothetical protein